MYSFKSLKMLKESTDASQSQGRLSPLAPNPPNHAGGLSRLISVAPYLGHRWQLALGLNAEWLSTWTEKVQDIQEGLGCGVSKRLPTVIPEPHMKIFRLDLSLFIYLSFVHSLFIHPINISKLQTMHWIFTFSIPFLPLWDFKDN